MYGGFALLDHSLLYCPMLRDTRQSWIVNPIPWIVNSRCWIAAVFSGTWILDSMPYIGTSEYLNSIPGSKALDSGYHEQNFPRILDSQILESDTLTWGEVLVKHFRTCSRIFNQAVGNLLLATFPLTFDFKMWWIGETSGQCSFFRLDHILN